MTYNGKTINHQLAYKKLPLNNKIYVSELEQLISYSTQKINHLVNVLALNQNIMYICYIFHLLPIIIYRKELEAYAGWLKTIIIQLINEKRSLNELIARLKLNQEAYALNEFLNNQNILTQEKHEYELIIKDYRILIEAFKVKYMNLRDINSLLVHQLYELFKILLFRAIFRANSKPNQLLLKNGIVNLLESNTKYYDHKLDNIIPDLYKI